MAEENMWKKQMLANKNKAAETKIDPPKPNDTSTNNNSTPPWVKNNSTPNTPALNNWTKNNSNTQTTNNSQPPWAKNNTNVINPPPPKVGVESPKPNTVNTPPWMKQNQDNAPSNTAPSPPWAKQAPQTSNNSPIKSLNNSTPPPTTNQPAWMKSNTQQESAPAWANKAANSSTQPSWANKAAGQTAASPPWMKNNDSVAPQTNNLLKAQKIADMQKEKKELEEKQRILEEEEKERKRQEKLRKEKEEQQSNIQRELKMMKVQDQFSSKRQTFDKEEIQRIERQKKEKQQRQQKQREAERARLERQRIEVEEKQKQRIRLQKQEKTRLQNERIELQKLEQSKSKSRSVKKSKRALQSSKISHISTIKGVQNLQSSSINALENIQMLPTQRDPSQPQNLFHKYTRLMNEQCCESDYRNKIAIQMAIIQTQLEFKRQCETEILSLFQKKKVTNRKRKIVFSNNMQIRYGLCEGKRGDNGLQFINSQAQKLRNIFLYYEAIMKSVVSLLKKKINIHFRVPLLNLAQYKGVTYLIEYICQELIQINETDIGLFQQISNQILILEKELQLCYDNRNDFLKPLSRNQLMVKKVNIYREDYYILYIKEDNIETKLKRVETSPLKPTHKIQNQIPSITYLKLIDYVANQSFMLPFYNPPLISTNKNYDLYQKIAPPASKHLIKEITLANSINTVYSSCQGEVDENIFFELVLNENKEIWDMIKSAGFTQKTVPSPITLSYLQKIASLRFSFTSKFYSKKQKQLIQAVKPTIYIQKHEFQMLEFIKNLEKYIAESKDDLVEESMKMNRQLWQEIAKSNTSNNESSAKLLQIKQEVNYLLFKHKQAQALEFLQKSQEKIPTYAIQTIPISLLFLKIFIKTDAQIKMLKKLSQLLQILQFYFKQQTIIHSYVYTIVGSYYSTKKNDEQREKKVITFYQHAINIALKLYGEKAQQVAEIYLSRATSMLNLNRNEAFQKDMSCAIKIYKMHSKNNSKIAECNYLLGKVSCMQGNREEGFELMQNSSRLFLKMGNYLETLNVLFEILHFMQGDQAKYEQQIQRIVQICFRFKSIWAFKRIINLLIDRQLHCYTSLTIQTIHELFVNEEEDRSDEEIMIDLQEEIKGFTSFIEIVRWSLSILAAKVIIRKQSTSDYWKAFNIVKDVIHFHGKEKKDSNLPTNAKETELI